MQKQTPLDLVLRELQSLHAVILASGDIWSPGVQVPDHLKREVSRHRRAVRNRVQQASIYTCPDPSLHRPLWDYERRQFFCTACARLAEGTQYYG